MERLAAELLSNPLIEAFAVEALPEVEPLPEAAPAATGATA